MHETDKLIAEDEAIGISRRKNDYRQISRATKLITLLVGVFCIFQLIRDKMQTDDRNVEISAEKRATQRSGSGGDLPHIALVFVDDWGWNDAGYQSTDLGGCMPHMDGLAQTGIILTNYYTQPLCSPARGALLTGKYPIHIGMQHFVIESTSPWGLSLGEKLWPEYMKELGYRTYMVGKWHLGHFNEAYLPNERGFDRFYGFYGNCISYFSHISDLGECHNPDCFQDLRENTEPVRNQDGIHTTYVLNSAATRIIKQHDSSEPMFLYYPVANVHSPIAVPDGMVDATEGALGQCIENIVNPPRKIYAALTFLLDEAIDNMTRAMQDSGLYENSVIIVASDNGADPLQQNKSAGGSGSNYPLRGMKGYMFDGGVRVPAFVHSPLLPPSVRGTKYHGLFHVTDWLPTVIAGIMDRADLLPRKDFDGIDQWDAITLRGGQIRDSVLINIDDYNGQGCKQSWSTAAFRLGDMKLVTNEADLPIWPVVSTKNVPFEMTVDWGGTMNWYLFNVTADPGESVNLMNEHPEIVGELSMRLQMYKSGMVNSSWCDSTTKKAVKTFNQTMFIGPWLADSTVSCEPRCTMAMR